MAPKQCKGCWEGNKMHSDLSPHLHTEECQRLIHMLTKCHADHPVGKFLGECNSIDNEMVRCLRKERNAKRLQNKEVAVQRRERLERYYAKLKQEGSS